LRTDLELGKIVLDADCPREMNLIYWTGWTIFRCFFTLYFRYRAEGVQNVPMTGAVLLASNHASFLDPPLIGSSLPREINYLARDTLFRVPLFGWVLRKVNTVPVDREGGGAAGLKAVLDRLKANQAIILFPEGTRTKTGELQTARSGIGLVVIKTNAPVVPARVLGSFEAMSRAHSFPRPHKIIVCFGKPLDFSRFREEAQSCSKTRLKEIYQEVADEIMQAIGTLEPTRAR
jgi:1-acyl-sn-glycerol-3-phosphate acyltransferase